jgi:hypothetical protein
LIPSLEQNIMAKIICRQQSKRTRSFLDVFDTLQVEFFGWCFTATCLHWL